MPRFHGLKAGQYVVRGPFKDFNPERQKMVRGAGGSSKCILYSRGGPQHANHPLENLFRPEDFIYFFFGPNHTKG